MGSVTFVFPKSCNLQNPPTTVKILVAFNFLLNNSQVWVGIQGLLLFRPVLVQYKYNAMCH